MKNSKSEKINVYQVFTRLFGNKNTTNKPWGTIEENGVGKFSDFDSTALAEIKKMGITHMWYTGVPHHDVIRDYTAYGIANDDPDVVKGRAGSPYAVKDYYNVNPDLADDPSRRLEEFEELIARTHANGLKVIIDIVPNHVARNYQSVTNPDQVESFGESDDTSVVYARDNNFYYIPGEDFQVPDFLNGYLPLGGEPNPLSDNKFKESPAKWTGNGSRLAKPGFYDWYETVKINYGVRPDGSKDFDVLPPEYAGKSIQEHAAFWADKSVPDSWIKFRDIADYWIGKGVDGFRYDMAEMVPVEFWSYMNSAIKTQNPDAFLLAEVYNPDLYRDYIFLGKMDYLYDKVALYDTLKNIMQGRGSTDNLVAIQESVADIEHHMLHFLENHDEQRIASVDFAGKAEKGKPAMVVSACISTSPTMLYFGQEVGEPGDGNPGFGSATRTTIFDYWGVPNHQRWMNNGAFDGGQLTEEETNLRDFYVDLLNIVRDHSAFSGKYKEIHRHNRAHTPYYNDRVFSFARWNDDEKLIVVTNFDAENTFGFSVSLDWDLINEWNLQPGVYELVNLLDDQQAYPMKVDEQGASVRVDLKPLESVILKMP
ncbi:MAG: alpha-amylase family protein [Bacteroidetes bacterium]|nr:alpha-amylase family protein [Bacteroidota bacterium]